MKTGESFFTNNKKETNDKENCKNGADYFFFEIDVAVYKIIAKYI